MSIVEGLNERGTGRLPGLIGLDVLEAGEGWLATRLELRDELLAPNGYLHAATIVALADTSCGYGTFVSLPEGAEGFNHERGVAGGRGPADRGRSTGEGGERRKGACDLEVDRGMVEPAQDRRADVRILAGLAGSQ